MGKLTELDVFKARQSWDRANFLAGQARDRLDSFHTSEAYAEWDILYSRAIDAGMRFHDVKADFGSQFQALKDSQ